MSTAPAPMTTPLAAPHDRETAHEHAWVTRSRHATSEGVLRYVRCVSCGAHRVDLQGAGTAAPQALRRAVGGVSPR